MPIVPAVCTQCGAAIRVNDAHTAAVCPYCRTTFVIEKAINQYHITNNYQINGGVVNLHMGPSMDELYKNARALILNGACMRKYADDFSNGDSDVPANRIWNL